MTTVARQVAETATDPELPMLTLADLGVLRDVEVTGEDAAVVTLTPTYSGCPAIAEMRADLHRRLTAAGYRHVEVRTALDPPWSSDWITEHGRAKLAEHGISPPGPAPERAGPVPLALEPPRPRGVIQSLLHGGSSAVRTSTSGYPARVSARCTSARISAIAGQPE